MLGKRTGNRIAAILGIVFGDLTIASRGQALFDGAEARATVGGTASFVVRFNFVAGSFYLVAGLGLPMPGEPAQSGPPKKQQA